MIKVSDGIWLDSYREGDQDLLVRYLNNRKIYERTLLIPFPYTRDDADGWLQVIEAKMDQTDFVIRDANENLMGGCGLVELIPGHRTDIGYWLGEPFWGQGVMSQVVPVLCEYIGAEWSLRRIGAEVFEGNLASMRVLEKAGFEFEGKLRRRHCKDGRFVDVRIFALMVND